MMTIKIKTMTNLFIAVGNNEYDGEYSILGICSLKSKAVKLCKSNDCFDWYYVKRFKLDYEKFSELVWQWDRCTNTELVKP